MRIRKSPQPALNGEIKTGNIKNKEKEKEMNRICWQQLYNSPLVSVGGPS
jgi:hypothetical protein